VVKKITAVQILGNYRIHLRFDDGIEGEVDLSQKSRTGVYAAWADYEHFRQARIGDCGELVWDNQVDFSADSLWLQVTGREPEAVLDRNPQISHA
jgi:hypothetical protein